MEKKNNILKQVEDSIMTGETKRDFKNILEIMPEIVGLNKFVYDEMIKRGFNKQQAFKFSCDYILSMLFNKNSIDKE